MNYLIHYLQVVTRVESIFLQFNSQRGVMVANTKRVIEDNDVIEKFCSSLGLF